MKNFFCFYLFFSLTTSMCFESFLVHNFCLSRDPARTYGDTAHSVLEDDQLFCNTKIISVIKDEILNDPRHFQDF